MAFAPSFSDISTQAASMNINSSNLFAVKGKYTLLLSLIPCDIFLFFFNNFHRISSSFDGS